MKRIPSRGYSILAALVFVAILSGVTFAIQSIPLGNGFAINAVSQRAEVVTGTSAEQDAKRGYSASLVTKPEHKRCTAPVELQRNKDANVQIDAKQSVMNTCVRGCLFKVSEKSGITEVDALDTCKDIKDANEKKNCEQTKRCIVQNCTGGTCMQVGGGQESAANKYLSDKAGVKETLPIQSDTSVQDALKVAKEDPSGASEQVSQLPPYLQKAFEEAKNDEVAKIATEKKSIEETLEGLADGNSEKLKLESDLAKLNEQQANLQKTSDELAANALALDPMKNPPGNIDDIEVSCSGSLCSAQPKTDSERKVLENSGFTCVGAETGPLCNKIANTERPKPTDTFPKEKDKTSTCVGANCGPGGQQQTSTRGGGGLGNLLGGGRNSPLSALGNFMQGLMRGINQQQGPPCPADPAAYQQYQQQYQQQMQQYNMQLQQYNYQQQIAQYNGYPPPPAPIEPVPCSQNTNANSCPTPPPQPTEACASGVWRPTSTTLSNGRQCTTGWQCAPGSSTAPKAELSCEPKIADIDMAVSLTYACTDATTSTGSGFSTGGALSGATTTLLSSAPATARSATYALTCRNQNLSDRAECRVQIARPKISLTARPNPVTEGATTTVAWVTSGMDSCVVSSPQMPEFTAANADAGKINGTATTPALAQQVDVLLTCQTVGGNTKTASTTIRVASSTPPISLELETSIDGRTDVRHGAIATTTWESEDAPPGSAMSLWVVDMQERQNIGLIRAQLPVTGSFVWTLPAANASCPSDLSEVCATELVPGRVYAIMGALYRPSNAYVGFDPPDDAIEPEYLEQVRGVSFKIAQ